LTLPLLGKKVTEEEEEDLSGVRDGSAVLDEKNMPVLGIAGGGIFFFWEIVRAGCLLSSLPACLLACLLACLNKFLSQFNPSFHYADNSGCFEIFGREF